MNEKTKQILRYVACGVGGLALGIGLLGGLAMCASSGNRSTAERVNTILTKKNAMITTDGGYSGYEFSFNLDYSSLENGEAYAYTYDMDTTTYEPTLLVDSYTLGDVSTYQNAITFINERYTASKSTQSDDLRFLLIYGKMKFATSQTSYYNFLYTTFVLPNAQYYMLGVKSFVWKNANDNLWLNRIDRNSTIGITPTSGYYIITQEQTNTFIYSLNEIGPSVAYQDVVSYYQELGYQEGYEEGETIGYNSGYADGFDAGSNNGLLFTDLGVNQLSWSRSDIVWDDQTDTTATMKLFDFKDGENQSYYVSFTDYSLGGGTPSVEVYKNGTASNNLYATIATGTWNNSLTQLEVIPSKYLKFDFAQITTYYHNSIPNGWFTLSGIPANATGYEVGYQTGYQDGFNASPGGQATNNVFSLFTNAFDSVGGIFNMKIFGFLPLYWFFLTPIFIAIITLLLRLIKH